MHTFTLVRKAETPLSTWGVLSSGGTELSKILERGPKNPDHQRIAAGTNGIVRRPFGESHFDTAFRDLLGDTYKGILLLENVPGRSNIEIHTANFVSQLLGCLATGRAIRTMPDATFFAVNSKAAYRDVYPIISAAIDNGGAQLVITDPEGTHP